MQIKNSFSSALTVAHADGLAPGALLKNIDLVLDVLNEWEKVTRKAAPCGPGMDFEGDIL